MRSWLANWLHRRRAARKARSTSPWEVGGQDVVHRWAEKYPMPRRGA